MKAPRQRRGVVTAFVFTHNKEKEVLPSHFSQYSATEARERAKKRHKKK